MFPLISLTRMSLFRLIAFVCLYTCIGTLICTYPSFRYVILLLEVCGLVCRYWAGNAPGIG